MLQLPVAASTSTHCPAVLGQELERVTNLWHGRMVAIAPNQPLTVSDLRRRVDRWVMPTVDRLPHGGRLTKSLIS
ncbi:hypothetical protein BH24CHL7_BH24CHL7_14150 [soil metagenome]